MARKEWEKYKVGVPSSGKGNALDCWPFTTVSNVGHVDHALRIVSDGQIRRNLVSDASKLNTERVLVVWLSPNHWGAKGFRYGNVAFTFDFAALVHGKNYYWVEAMTKYSPSACRILITSEDHSHSKKLTVYDPTTPDGPWWYDTSNDKHFFNGKYCLEFMVEADLPLGKARKVDFVAHHDGMCSVHSKSPKSCPEFGLFDGQGGARFIAAAVARNVELSGMAKSLVQEAGKLSPHVRYALTLLLPRRFFNEPFTFNGKVAGSSDTGKAIARALLNALALEQKSEADLLAALFRSEKSMLRAVAAIVSENIGWDEDDVLEAVGT